MFSSSWHLLLARIYFISASSVPSKTSAFELAYVTNFGLSYSPGSSSFSLTRRLEFYLLRLTEYLIVARVFDDCRSCSLWSRGVSTGINSCEVRQFKFNCSCFSSMQLDVFLTGFLRLGYYRFIYDVIFCVPLDDLRWGSPFWKMFKDAFLSSTMLKREVTEMELDVLSSSSCRSGTASNKSAIFWSDCFGLPKFWLDKGVEWVLTSSWFAELFLWYELEAGLPRARLGVWSWIEIL